MWRQHPVKTGCQISPQGPCSGVPPFIEIRNSVLIGVETQRLPGPPASRRHLRQGRRNDWDWPASRTQFSGWALAGALLMPARRRRSRHDMAAAHECRGEFPERAPAAAAPPFIENRNSVRLGIETGRLPGPPASRLMPPIFCSTRYQLAFLLPGRVTLRGVGFAGWECPAPIPDCAGI
jgi:hypothetical protein